MCVEYRVNGSLVFFLLWLETLLRLWRASNCVPEDGLQNSQSASPLGFCYVVRQSLFPLFLFGYKSGKQCG